MKSIQILHTLYKRTKCVVSVGTWINKKNAHHNPQVLYVSTKNNRATPHYHPRVVRKYKIKNFNFKMYLYK